jgi:hypothetical protein
LIAKPVTRVGLFCPRFYDVSTIDELPKKDYFTLIGDGLLENLIKTIRKMIQTYLKTEKIAKMWPFFFPRFFWGIFLKFSCITKKICNMLFLFGGLPSAENYGWVGGQAGGPFIIKNIKVRSKGY